MDSTDNTLFPSLPGLKPQEESKDEISTDKSHKALNSKARVEDELDYEAMFAAMEANDTGVIHANEEDGVVDVRDLLGKCGRDTQADKPNIIITETSKEKQNQAKSHLPDYIEESKLPIDYSK